MRISATGMILAMFLCTGVAAPGTVVDAKAWVTAQETGPARPDTGDSEAEAAYNLGVKFYEGSAHNTARAVEWFRKAAELGLAKGQARLGAACEKGEGVAKNYDEALKWYGRAARQSDSGGQTGLGNLYAAGHGVERDDAEAAKWYQLAAAQDAGQAQYGLGLLYMAGNGVKMDYAEAYFWLALAARSVDSAMEKRDEAAQYLSPWQLEKIRTRIDEWRTVRNSPPQ